MRPARRKCLHLYFYFLDRQLGLIHVKLQTWFPFPIQVYVNGHEWLARRLDRHGVRYRKRDNVCLQVSDLDRAQKLADGFASVDWVRVLGRKLTGNFLDDVAARGCLPGPLRRGRMILGGSWQNAKKLRNDVGDASCWELITPQHP